MNFQEKLDSIIDKNDSLLCVGLDSDSGKISPELHKQEHSQFAFNKSIVEKTADLVCAYKPNTAFYESRGIAGIADLKLTCDFIRTTYPYIPIILDAKRGDIGNTNNGYLQFAFEYLQADAITIHPYLGQEAVQPFLDYKDKGIIILCRTSNPGAREFQDLPVNGTPLYKQVAQNVVENWNKNNNCLLVVGATYPQELAEIRRIAGDMTFLVPGIGAQGGDVEKTVKAGLNSKKKGIIINSSRGIIFAEDPKKEAEVLRDKINSFRK
jgi:orotidine 5'-phosphate decarboxylase subfamily 2